MEHYATKDWHNNHSGNDHRAFESDVMEPSGTKNNTGLENNVIIIVANNEDYVEENKIKRNKSGKEYKSKDNNGLWFEKLKRHNNVVHTNPYRCQRTHQGWQVVELPGAAILSKSSIWKETRKECSVNRNIY